LETDDDDPAVDWEDAPETVSDEHRHRLDTPRRDLTALARTTAVETSPERLPGYQLGRRDEQMTFFRTWDELLKTVGDRRAAEVLLVLRDEVEAQTRDRAFADEFMRRIGIMAGVKFC
jgi:hypothetical protein